MTVNSFVSIVRIHALQVCQRCCRSTKVHPCAACQFMNVLALDTIHITFIACRQNKNNCQLTFHRLLIVVVDVIVPL